VTRFQPGDEVFGWTDGGSYAEYACAPEDHFAPKPSNLSVAQAAAVPISGFAAHDLGVRACISLSGITSRTRQTHRTPEPWVATMRCRARTATPSGCLPARQRGYCST
jgi:NADPH:quinone reductase-like Zn-dependent oxidoreductase